AVVLAVSSAACSSGNDWDRKDAWRRCDDAINDWPDRPAPPCAAMHMCANEAPLSPEARQKLVQMIAATPGCPAP
ncbi:MAG: hypothetical protein M0R80_31805, partial [Proteobacteria bacterium]|nr:hypothetical protein [Pseudomonadota bacterium]